MSWEEYSLNELGTLSRGRSRHRPRDAEFLYGGQYPFIQTGDVKRAALYLNEFSQTYSEAGLAQSKLWPAGTLCITIAANIAETAILDMDACFPDSIIGFIADSKKTNTKFIKYQFDALLKKRMKTVSQGAAQDNLSQAKLLSFLFPAPDIEEQNRIADTLSAYDDLIENNRRRIALLEEYARLLYRDWFVHLRFPGHETTKIIDGVPEGWSHGVMEDLFQTSSGGTPSRKKPEFYGGTVNWLKTQELNGDFIFATKEKITEAALRGSSAKLFEANTVIVAMYGATIGELCILAEPSATNQACCALIPKKNPKDYVFAFTMMDQMKSLLKDRGQGSAQTNVSQQVIKNLDILVPSREILDKFNEVIEPNFLQRKTLQKKALKLAQARDILLPRLMDGRVEL